MTSISIFSTVSLEVPGIVKEEIEWRIEFNLVWKLRQGDKQCLTQVKGVVGIEDKTGSRFQGHEGRNYQCRQASRQAAKQWVLYRTHYTKVKQGLAQIWINNPCCRSSVSISLPTGANGGFVCQNWTLIILLLCINLRKQLNRQFVSHVWLSGAPCHICTR